MFSVIVSSILYVKNPLHCLREIVALNKGFVNKTFTITLNNQLVVTNIPGIQRLPRSMVNTHTMDLPLLRTNLLPEDGNRPIATRNLQVPKSQKKSDRDVLPSRITKDAKLSRYFTRNTETMKCEG